MEPNWQRLQKEYGSRLRITYKMGGLLPCWGMYDDARNSIRKPIQMGPEWMHARHVTGVDIDNRIWVFDPPASSFPACIAVKSAELQSREFGAQYLALTRKAVMTENKNIARVPLLLDLAADLHRREKNFDLRLFREDLQSRGPDAFRQDWKEARYRGINRFPTLIITPAGYPTIALRGYQTYESLNNLFTNY